MGGINHQPTSNVSYQLTVPASAALSAGFARFLDGNTSVEAAIQIERTEFGVAKGHLISAAGYLEQSAEQAMLANRYVDRLKETLDRPDYQPFSVLSVDPVALVTELREAGMLLPGSVTDTTADVLAAGGYTKAFEAHRRQIGLVITETRRTAELIRGYLDSEHADQGFFWSEVENNRLPFRQQYARALTAWITLFTSWQTSALISTEVYLQGIGVGGLL